MRVPAVALAFLLAGGCASAQAAPAELVFECERLFETAPEGTTVAREDMPRLLNGGDVYRRLVRLYGGNARRQAVLQLLVQPEGRASHGCVRQPSGDPAFDRAALEAARTARFRPAMLGGRAVDAWVTIPLRSGS